MTKVRPVVPFSDFRRLGDAGLCLTDPADIARYTKPARGAAGEALCVLRPKTTGQVSAIVALCGRLGLPLTVQAGNTGLVGDSTPAPGAPAIILSLERMKERFVLNPINRSLKVSAGFRLSEMNARLAPHGLFFPIDLSSDPMAGGLVASNAGGARFLRYGDVRDRVLGLTVVLADERGTVVQIGQGVRKDNSGPDWKQMFIGAGPFLGIVTECEFDLARLPADRVAALLIPASGASVDVILDELERTLGPGLTAFESMSDNAVRHALAHVPNLRTPFRGELPPGEVLLVEFSRDWHKLPGDAPAADVLNAQLERLWEDERNLLLDAVPGPPEDFWRLRHSLSEGLRAAGPVIAFDLAFRRDRVNAFKAQIREDYSRRFPELELCDFGHVGDGGVHLNFIVRQTSAEGEQALRHSLEAWVLDIAVGTYGGTFSAEHGVGRKNLQAYLRFTDPALRQATRALKEAVAPVQIGGFRAD
ncbi:FAD-binding oxidoreductase [Hyphomonas sp. NPDC076900]|uniref:FAD-binding oxidoreductase n=1 Tax=unclassified Hyphomonas TaxID=2630699 RepID=UPI003D05383F